MKRLFSKTSKKILNKSAAILCILLLGFSLFPHVNRAYAATSFTVSNVTFDPTTGALSFESSTNFGSSSSNWEIEDAGLSSVYWNNGQSTSCSWDGSNSHCQVYLYADTADTGVTQATIYGSYSGSNYASQTLNYPLPHPTTNTPQTPSAGGWTGAGETWTYASADSPTFTATASGDLTGVYTPGMRVELTQSSTTEYFLVTAVSYSSPNTTITLYGGTDYTLANSTISNILFSADKAPVGFPLDPAKWTVQTIYTSSGNQGSPTANTWYNIGNASLTVPIGTWRLFYSATYGYDSSSSQNNYAYITLSTANNSQSDANMTSQMDNYSSYEALGTGYKEKLVNLTSKTTYYLNEMAGSSGTADLYVGGTNSPAIIRAVSTYL